LATPIRWAVIAAAIAGAALGSKLLFWLEDPQLTLHNLNNLPYVMGGKTIVGALIFGLISVELMKRYIGVDQSTGDLYAIPLALGIAIGRVGCFLTGLSDNTYGTPTTIPWAINFGDGIPRHPTQLYEIIFLLLLIPILYRVVILSEAGISRSEVLAQKDLSHNAGGSNPEARRSHDTAVRSQRVPDFSRPLREVGIGPAPTRDPKAALAEELKPSTPFLPGDAFKLFMVAYLSFRFLCDFIKPYPRIFLGLAGIQWACLLTLLYYADDIARWFRSHAVRSMTIRR
jgi:phosphatidylglycerol---prolipoprotein diacylglyceryl transferase